MASLYRDEYTTRSPGAYHTRTTTHHHDRSPIQRTTTQTTNNYTTPYNRTTHTTEIHSSPVHQHTVTHHNATRTTNYHPSQYGARTSALLASGGRTSQVIETREGPSRFVEERYIGERVTNVTERAMEHRLVHAERPQLHTYVNEVELWDEEPIVKENIIEKSVEVLVEKKVPYERYVDVEYDVVYERPIEKIIEKEVEIQRIMERDVERIVEVPVQRIVEVPYERRIEKPVPIDRRVDVPYERIVERKIEDIVENVVFHDNYRDVDVNDLHMYPHAQKLQTEVRVREHERYIDNPIYVDNIVEKYVDVPVERIIQVPFEKIV
jgi:hypothetical protein